MLALTLAITGAVVAAIATAAALWQASLLRKQLISDDRVRRASFYQEITQLILRLDYIFVENPEWRPYFYGDHTPSDPQTEQQLLALAEYVVDIVESCTAAEQALPELMGDWDDYFNYLYRNSPSLRRYWTDFGHLYPPRVARVFVGPSARPKVWPMQPETIMDDNPVGSSSEDPGTLADVYADPAYTEEMHYSEVQATAYRDITLEGSTYEVSLGPAISSMGDISGMTVLDFGTGTGRTACALRSHNARHVLAVDNNLGMLRAADHCPGVTYLLTGRSLPIAESSIDAALCANVFSEFSSLDDIVDACREIHTALKPGRCFTVVVPNPESVFCDYVSYRYISIDNPQSGSPITCLIKGPKPIIIQDYYWSLRDYVSALEIAGFIVDELLMPRASANTGQWLDETKVAPDLVIRCISADR